MGEGSVPSNMVESLNPGGILGYVDHMKKLHEKREEYNEIDSSQNPQ